MNLQTGKIYKISGRDFRYTASSYSVDNHQMKHTFVSTCGYFITGLLESELTRFCTEV